MTELTIYSEDNPNNPLSVSTNIEQIQTALNDVNIFFDQWSTRTLDNTATSDDILKAYQSEIALFIETRDYKTADVIRLTPAHPDKQSLREKFLSEHTHAEDEVRFFVEGTGLFCIHAQKKVFALVCTAGDLISVPARTRHWFDMGPEPDFTCIRIFNNPEGWVADFTGATIAAQFPNFA